MKISTELITDYLNKKCNEETKKEIEVWIQKNPKNRAYFEELKAYWDAKNVLYSSINVDVDAGFKNLRKKKAIRKKLPFRKFMNYAAVFAALLTTGIVAYFQLTTTNPVVVHNKETIEKMVLLPDGTSVFLAQKASIEYAADFLNAERIVRLKGEAFFNVAKKQGKLFTVVTTKTQTVVLGTSFRISEGENKTSIKVRTGLVEFKELGNPKNKTMLRVGETAQYVNKQNVILQGTLKSGNNHFVVKRLNYKNEKLTKICEDLNELFAVEISLANEKSKDLSLSAVFENQDLDSILKSICFTLDLETEKKERYILLK